MDDPSSHTAVGSSSHSENVGELLRHFPNAIVDYAIILLTVDNRVVSWNTGAERLLGYSQAEILGQSGKIFFTPEDQERGAAEEEIRIARKEGRAADERWHVRKSGARFWGSGVMTAVRDEQGELQGFAKVMRDETQRHSLLQRLRDSEQRLQLAQALASAGTWEWRVAEDSCVWSESMGLLFGLPSGTSLGTIQFFLARIHEEDRAGVEASLQQCLSAGGSVEVRFRVVWPEGTLHWLLAIGQLFRNQEGEAERLLGVAMDITERQKWEEAAAREKRHLAEKVQKTGEALDRTQEELRALAASLFTAQDEERRRIARELHDGLGQQLASLQLKLELMRQEAPALAAPLLAAIGQAAALSDELRELSHRLHPGVLELIGLDAALRSLCEEWEQIHDLPVRCTCPPLSRPVPLPISSALYRITQEALRNVQKHAGDARVTIAMTEQPQQLRLTIKDDGSGFDPQVTRPLSGMGMISMRERVSLLGGQLDIRSALGKGTEIEVCIPWSQTA